MKRQFGQVIRTIDGILGFLYTPIAFLLRLMRVRVLDMNFYAIGHLAIEPDLYLREQRLLQKQYFTILLPPHSSLHKGFSLKLEIANPFLLKCWEKHFCLITNSFLYLLLLPLLRSPHLQMDPRPYLASKTFVFHNKEREAALIYNKFNKIYGPIKPFIQLKQKDLKRGERGLERLGIPPGQWYACFSCREFGHYSQDSVEWSSCRNSTMAHLELALKEIISRGGWCIRMGSPKAAPLPACLKRYERIIDYPHTEEVNDFLDIYLASSCKLFLGNNNGITVTSSIFGVPSVYANIVPFGERPIFHNAIGIFKLQRSKTTGQFIPFSQSLQSHLSTSISLKDYDEFGVELVENTPEEIYEVVKEMLDRLENRLVYLPEEEGLQQRFRSLLTSFNLSYRAESRIGKEFLKKYDHLM